MDPLSLGLVGVFAAWVARPEGVTARHAAWCGVLGGLAPDVDVASGLAGIGQYMAARGTLTHALWALPLLALAVAVLVRWRTKGDVSLAAGARCAWAAAVAHVVLEALSIQGVAPLAPFHDGVWRASLLHTVDLVLLALLALPLWLPPLVRRTPRVRGLAGLGAVAFTLALAAGAHAVASSSARELAAAEGVAADARTRVWPAPLWTWERTVAVTADGVANVGVASLWRGGVAVFAERIPLNEADEAVRTVMKQLGVLLAIDNWDQPVAQVRTDAKETTIDVWLEDLRYHVPGWGNLAPRVFARVQRRGLDHTVKAIRWRWVRSIEERAD